MTTRGGDKIHPPGLLRPLLPVETESDLFWCRTRGLLLQAVVPLEFETGCGQQQNIPALQSLPLSPPVLQHVQLSL